MDTLGADTPAMGDVVKPEAEVYTDGDKNGAELGELARELMSGKGYIIASTRELKEKYGDLSHYDVISDDKDIWGISMNFSKRKLLFVAI